ncbi:radial spoke head 14 homolog [Clupea harengus]|uniref:Radial spoke head 14 homolog n=1 Tax=Clupea harengus TaxID=7950 RepID=A0A6P8FBC2_CLUHA|nr:radial spoke head 14 homolog [Clupea harengus]XP_042564078.1 radial spoke head 14 homolog [Clupea harengus]
MGSPRISEQLPPLLDSTKAPVAFGNRALPRLSMDLQDPRLYIRQRALAALCDLVHDPERAYETIQKDSLEILKVLLKDEDAAVRTKTTEVLYLLATHNVGREAFLRYNVVGPLSDLLDEPVDACRRNMHRALKMVAEFPAGAACIVAHNLVHNLVEKVTMESVDIRALLLGTLSCCVQVNAIPALQSNGVAILREQLASESLAIRRAAASAMVGISVPIEGKQRVCEENVLPVLVRLLSDKDPEVSASAAGTIMNTAVITRGKYQALEAGAIPPLLGLVKSDIRAVSANALRALTCLAEAPPARLDLLEHLPLLRTRLSHPEPIIQRAAETAIHVISWKP